MDFEKLIVEWNKKNERPLRDTELKSILRSMKKEWGRYKTPKYDNQRYWSIVLKSGKDLYTLLKNRQYGSQNQAKKTSR